MAAAFKGHGRPIGSMSPDHSRSYRWSNCIGGQRCNRALGIVANRYDRCSSGKRLQQAITRSIHRFGISGAGQVAKWSNSRRTSGRQFENERSIPPRSWLVSNSVGSWKCGRSGSKSGSWSSTGSSVDSSAAIRSECCEETRAGRSTSQLNKTSSDRKRTHAPNAPSPIRGKQRYRSSKV